MAKKKATKKKASKPRPDTPMSKGFGHLTIKRNWIVKGESSVQGGEDDRPDSRKCWEDYDWGE